MALNPQVIGKDFPHGFAGCYARQPDMIVNTRPAGGTAPITFGTPLKYSAGAVVPMGASDTAALFVGTISRQLNKPLGKLGEKILN